MIYVFLNDSTNERSADSPTYLFFSRRRTICIVCSLLDNRLKHTRVRFMHAFIDEVSSMRIETNDYCTANNPMADHEVVKSKR